MSDCGCKRNQDLTSLLRRMNSGSSLSSGLCHGRCACMAGHPIIKNYNVLVSRGDRTGISRGLPSLVWSFSCSLFLSAHQPQPPQNVFSGLSFDPIELATIEVFALGGVSSISTVFPNEK